MNPDTLNVWTVYRSPLDAPGLYVVRRFEVRGGQAVPREGYTAQTLEEVRRHVPAGLTRLEREEEDDTVVVETWM